MRHATEDPSWQARVLTRLPLLYAAGADHAQDRPAHVRAGSGIRWVGDQLAVIQDDARFIALVNPTAFSVRALALPAGKGGVRLFDDTRGNKDDKLDLEASLVVHEGGDELLLAFGSGSKKVRDQVAVVNVRRGTAVIRDATALYRDLRDFSAFAGCHLNIEGAILTDGVVRFFNRGNGKPRHGLRPVNATVDVEWRALWSYLLSPDDAPVPGLHNIQQYDLGEHGGLRLTFTDACAWGGRVLFTAAAEDSPDATEDGPVAGSAIGVIEASGEVRYTMLRGEGGGAFLGKVEGVALSRTEAGRIYLVTDADDADAPAELCLAELSPWPA
jgi:hypothetical protein